MTHPWGLGSEWLRWDPHVHAPGTLRNDQFGGDWVGYLARIREASPPASALGITDYFTLRGYKEFRQRRGDSLPGIRLAFANIELRLTIETEKRQGINLHLLISPETTDHVERTEEKLAGLSFQYLGNSYPCSDQGLIRLGRAFTGNPQLPDEAALQQGANQFKVDLEQVRSLFTSDAWVRANVLVAVAAGEDGLAGLSRDAAFVARRRDLGRFSDIVFSGNPGDREFWLGNHQTFEVDGHRPRPCLHGSDAHDLNRLLRPDLDRLCWLKGAPTFDTLRQTLLEPERRVHIGATPPEGPSAIHQIQRLSLGNAAWIKTPVLEFNRGLVTVIGARGSGKTALADFLALAADAAEPEPGPASFFRKADDLVAGASTALRWADGDEPLRAMPADLAGQGEPRARYLSQQFVERLCGSTDLSQPLVDEIERVVFSAIAEEDRRQCQTFQELRDLLTEGPRSRAAASRDSIRERTHAIADEHRLKGGMGSVSAKLDQAKRERLALEAQLAQLPAAADAAKEKALSDAERRLSTLRAAIAAEERHAGDLGDLLTEVERIIAASSRSLAALKARYGALIDEETWAALSLQAAEGALDKLVTLRKDKLALAASFRTGGTVELPESGPSPAGLEAMVAAAKTATDALGADKAQAQRRLLIGVQLRSKQQEEERLAKEFDHASKASERMEVPTR